MRTQIAKLVIITAAFLGGVIFSAAFGLHAQETTTPPPISTAAPPTYRPFEPPTTDLLFEAVPGPDVPTLQELTAGTTTSTEGIAAVVVYYEANRDRLAVLWRETNPTRLAALFTMYVVHISHIYGETEYTESLTDYLAQPRAHCGTYSVAQSHIADALGLEWRMFELTSGWHGWIEIMVDGRWEIFDATTNTWIDRSGLELLEGGPRQYRYFYTPLLDMERNDARLHLSEGYNMQRFRIDLPGLGLYYNPPGEPFLSERPQLWSASLQ